MWKKVLVIFLRFPPAFCWRGCKENYEKPQSKYLVSISRSDSKVYDAGVATSI
jgi:hypothetical protein